MKKLLLHTCCAPCLTSVNENVSGDFDITAFWFNPNIEPSDEYELRLENFESFCAQKNIPYNVGVDQKVAEWQGATYDFGDEPEGGKRCKECINFRLEATARAAKKNGFDIFGTTLSVSPHKNAAAINQIGSEIAVKYDLEFLTADFKKKNGYKRSIELSKEYALYRQNYCGCVFSKKN